jgi:cytochrome c553
MLKTRVAVAIALLGIVLAGCSAAAGTTPAEIVSSRCTRCHSIDRIKAAQHDAAGWQATVTRMRSNGAQLSDTEIKAVADFLAGGGAAGL